MRSYFYPLLACLTCISAPQYAQECERECDQDIYHTFQLGLGYRQDRLKWVITDEFRHIDPLSKLRWEDVRSVQVVASDKITYCDRLSLKVKGSYGEIFHGRNSDTDYTRFGSGSEFPFIRSRANANKGEVYNGSIGIGYEMVCNNVSILPLVGCSIDGQNLHMTHGYVDLNLTSDFMGSFSGLNSSYKTTWLGPWFGCEVWMVAPCDIDVYGTFEYHTARYHAWGDWNLREDLLGDFHHEAWGHGVLFALGLGKHFCECWEFRVDGTYQAWITKSGVDHTVVGYESSTPSNYPSNIVPVRLETNLKYVKWNSWSINGSVTRWF